MKNQWYCGVEGQQYGPFTWEQLRAMAAEGRIVTDSFVRRDVDQQWFQAAQVPGLLPKAHAAKRSGASSSSIGKAGRTSESGAMASVGGDPPKSATAMKRPRKAASHSSGNIPVGAVPVGQAVATPPAGIPVGQPVAATPTPQFAFSTIPTAGTSNAASDPPEPAKKGNNTLLIVGILGGACALVALIGVGAVVWSLTRAAKAVNEQIADADAELLESLEGLANDLQENPQTLSADLQPIAEEMQKALQENVGNAAGGATPAAAPASSAEATKLVKSLSKWTDASQLRGIELNKLKLNLGSVWLASDEKGTRVQPAADGSAGAKFVFVEVNVRNVAPVARSFTSWNATGGTSVVLADQNDAVLHLVPPTSTPATNRLTTVELQPGQNVTDTLVFTAPGGKIETFKLALAKSALAEGAKFRTGSHLALEIPVEMLMTRAGGETAAQDPIAASLAPMPAGEQPAIIVQEPAAAPLPAGNPPPTAAPAPMPKKEDRPPTREELNKQFEELSKKEGQPEAKKGEAQK